MKTSRLLLLFITFLSPLSIAADREVPFRVSPDDPVTCKVARRDYSQYEPIPDTPTSAAYRKVLKTIPYTRERAFWGRWAGSGCEGGQPVDDMDEIFRRHDIVYGEAESLRAMKWADAACVEALQKLDTSGMSPEAIAFRNRSASFFANRRLSFVGKPVSSYFCSREEKDCPFQCEDDVREVFGLSKKGDAAPGEDGKNGKWGQVKAVAKKLQKQVSASSRRPVKKVRKWFKKTKECVWGE